MLEVKEVTTPRTLPSYSNESYEVQWHQDQATATRNVRPLRALLALARSKFSPKRSGNPALSGIHSSWRLFRRTIVKPLRKRWSFRDYGIVLWAHSRRLRSSGLIDVLRCCWVQISSISSPVNACTAYWKCSTGCPHSCLIVATSSMSWVICNVFISHSLSPFHCHSL